MTSSPTCQPQPGGAGPADQARSLHRDPFIGKRLLSDDGHCTLIQVSLGTPYLALQTRATVDRAEAGGPSSLARAGRHAAIVYTTGPAGIGRDLVAADGNSPRKHHARHHVLVVVILLIVYRSPLLALVPLATIGSGHRGCSQISPCAR